MPATWTAPSFGVAYASAKSMLDCMNAVASAKTIKIYQILIFNNGTAAVTGVLVTMVIRHLNTASAAGSAVTPVKHDTTNAALDANTSFGTGRTITPGSTVRHYVMSNDEPSVSAATMDEWECLVPNAAIWTAGYGDSNVQPLTCTAANAVGTDIQQSTTSAVGSADLEMLFTSA